MISVVMPAFNAAPFLADSIQSILNQTYRDFEFVIVNDGSTDDSRSVLEKYAKQDRRIRVLHIEHANVSVAGNRCMEVATRPYIARMDADDIALPSRLELQLEYLHKNQACVAVGGWVEVVDRNGWPIRVWRYEQSHDEIDQANLDHELGPRLSHPTIMMRAEAVQQIGGYREQYAGCEDWDLYLRLGEIGRLANLPKVLVKCRQHLASFCHRKRDQQRIMRLDVLRDAYRRRHLEQRVDDFKETDDEQDFSHAGYFRLWAWWALQEGNLATARKYAIKSLLHAPWKTRTWNLTARMLMAHLRPATLQQPFIRQ